MASWRNYCCSCENLKRRSRLRERLLPTWSYSMYARYYMYNFYVSLKFFYHVVITTIAHLNQFIVGLCRYFFPLNVLSKQNCTMRCGTMNPFRFCHVYRWARTESFWVKVGFFLWMSCLNKSAQCVAEWWIR